jgi:carbohydrate-binding DOMON domain-containing protein
VTLPVKPGTVLPNASCAATWTAGVIGDPAGVFAGRLVNTSLAAGPTMMAKGALVTPGSPATAAVSV